MKQYEITPLVWNPKVTDWDFDYDHCEHTESYKQAVIIAKRLCERFKRADIRLYQLNKSDCCDEQEYHERWTYDRADQLTWIESFADGQQCPVLFSNGEPIWRWNIKGYPVDLKPRKCDK